jgi:Dockerin type I domain
MSYVTTRVQRMRIMNTTAMYAFRIALATTLFLVASQHASAQTAADCPFNLDQSSVANSRRATTDGLIFIRYALGLPSTTPPVASASENAALTPAQVAAHMSTNANALDIDGDGKFSAFDAQVIARYLLGFRNAWLVSASIPEDFPKRSGVQALQNFIETGCTGTSDAPDPRVVVWNAMNAQLALGTVAGIDAAKTYMTDTAVGNYTGALTAIIADLPAVVASYSPIIPRQVSSDYAEYWVSRPLAGSVTGERLIHIVTFLRTFDGSWRVDSM